MGALWALMRAKNKDRNCFSGEGIESDVGIHDRQPGGKQWMSLLLAETWM
jgi:hypothetical protein